jgi:hypothetical protein
MSTDIFCEVYFLVLDGFILSPKGHLIKLKSVWPGLGWQAHDG